MSHGEKTTPHNPPTKPPVKLTGRKKLVFALIVGMGFFLLLEGALVVLGIGADGADGGGSDAVFETGIPVFVESADDAGLAQMMTAEHKLQWFNQQQFPKEKPPKTYRIFCVGGSTTHGYPFKANTSFGGWLAEMLAATDDSRQWEIINAGGISYASRRVAMLMDELAGYDPDLFIVYSGQNEFLERWTYAALLETPETVREVRSMLGKTRTYRVVRALLGKSGEKAPPQDDKDLDSQLLSEEVGLEAYHRDEAINREVLASYRENLERIINVARQSGAKIIFVQPASNLRDCSPWKSEHRVGLAGFELQKWNALVQQAEAAFAAEQFDPALSSIAAALQIDDRFAHLHYLRAQVLDRLGRTEEAKVAYLRSREEDVCPLRTLSAMNDIVVEVAKKNNVPLIDFIELTAANSPDGIPGQGLFYDHVHPTVEGNRILGRAIYERMIAEGIVTPKVPLSDELNVEISQTVEGRIDRRANGVSLSNLSQVLHKARKYEEAGRVALQALELAPDDADVQFLAGSEFARRGKFDRAAECFHRAVEINPEHAEAHNNLGLVFNERNDFDQAEQHLRKSLSIMPDYAEAHNNLGIVHARQGKTQAAMSNFQKALELRTDYREARENLRMLQMGR